MDGWDWLWMALMMGAFWILVISVAVFIGVRLAQRPRSERHA